MEKQDRFFASSKLCRVCGKTNHLLKLSDRAWVCAGCGAFHDRDHNAALNLLIKATGEVPESYALGVMSRAYDSAQEAHPL